MVELTVEQALMRANSHAKKGEIAEAQKLYQLVLQTFPNNKRAQQGLSALTKQTTKATDQAPPQEQIDALIALFNSGRLNELIAKAKALVDQHSSSFVVWNILAVAQKALGKVTEAETGFRKAIALNPDYANAYNNLGIVLKEQGKVDDAIAAYQRTLELKPTESNAYYNMGLALELQGKFDEAIQAYQSAIKNNKSLADAHNNIGNILTIQGKNDEAMSAYKCAIELNPNLAEASNNIGNILAKQGKHSEAIQEYKKAIKNKTLFPEAYFNLGNSLKDQGRIDEAILAYQYALKKSPDHAKSEANMLHQKQHICDFTVNEKLQVASVQLGIETKDISPFLALSWADAPQHNFMRAISRSRAKYKHSQLPLPARPKAKPERIKVGYFSADFHDHATMYLMAGLLREHNEDEFELFAYSYGRSKSGNWRQRAEEDVDHFFDVTDYSDRQIVDLARSHGLDIAIDLKGYTQHTRSGIFQYRLAPIQMNYLGYPGTMGADFIDYIIADPIVIPRVRMH